MPKKTIEDEVDEIKLQIYEETKDMTSQELGEYYRKHGEACAKKYGFKIYNSVEEAEQDRRRKEATI